MYNFAGILDHHVARRPDKVMLTSAETRTTNRTLYERVNALAAALADRGVGRGHLVALGMNNRSEVIESLLAINRIGAAFLPLNTRLSPPEWGYILAHSGAIAAIVEDALTGHIDAIGDGIPELTTRIALDVDPAEGWLSYEQLITHGTGSIVPVADVAEDDLHRLLYTSGTTSRPKGVPITFKNLWWKNHSHILELDITEHDSNLVCGPLYHVGALDAPALDVLHAGGSLIIHRKFDATQILRSIHQDRPTITWMAPAMINTLLQHPDLASCDRSSLRLILFGGEKTPRSLIERLSAAFPSVWLSDAYGLTESTSADTFNDAAHALSKAGSVGRPTLHLQLRIVAPDGTDAAPGELGEIAMRGPQVVSGYWRDPDTTAQVFRAGWFYSGDIGRLDEDGYLFVEDRKKDMIVSGGENIASSEVERVLYEHPDVLEAAVVAAPDERWGETPMAFVVTRRDSPPLEGDELQDFCRARLARFKVPKHIRFVDALPRNPSGKVLKRELRTWTATAEATHD